MNRDAALKYQAYLDGELPERQARQVAEALAQDPEAQALVTELRATKQALKGNEPEIALPESREFYWTRIQREIQRLEAQPVERGSDGWLAVLAGWRRYLAPMAGVAVIAFLAVAMLRTTPNPIVDQHLAEIENLSEHTTSFSFRSDNMFVVWVQETGSEVADSEADFISNDDSLLQ
ncbi:MAG: hypothetical protein L0Y58_10160 [Verrucomicrobia subdivision 3 bacterium]|nr:hypothetical protein [Limisphaerales bacterium]